jgi:hypothetical protein
MFPLHIKKKKFFLKLAQIRLILNTLTFLNQIESNVGSDYLHMFKKNSYLYQNHYLKWIIMNPLKFEVNCDRQVTNKVIMTWKMLLFEKIVIWMDFKVIKTVEEMRLWITLY